MQFVFFRTFKLPKYIIPSMVLIIALGMIISFSAFYQYMNRERAVISLSLVHQVVVVDAGHGGIDPGAVGPAGTLEKDINLAVAKRLCDNLSQAGAIVIMTREDDQSYSNIKKTDLDARIALAEKHQAQVFISIQGNALKSSRWSGAQTFYHPGSKEGERLAVCIQDEMGRILKNTKRKALPHTEAYILRQLSMPTVVVEVGFISNPEEEKMLNDPQYQGKLAWAIYSGLAKYFTEE
ncbi:N-acetylmuramoyl-L-alanine amidase [Dehalobacterium formicoaceticum]|uniref:N-acetylmuramoyl-L-alanine amidase n=1 Tax=Dehalobacterium formicoaceticum TaxID=51515 RepID=A0ABT1XZF4_9FIRM|nr:N-acetylmuramoyl-L-alanine amidase [Dehalobacterium formicoaceticum]MCR6543994.1 N-acetylmuramoyl-L-alanine amidase [Dehalobacterium formicoaceticum]